MSSTFPTDEFDVEPPGTGRRGAHRARPNPVVAVVPLVLVTVAVVAIIVAAMTLLGGSGSPSSPVPDAGGDLPTASAADTTTGETSSPAESPTSSATASPTESAPESTVDPSLPVSVLNGTRTSGLAASAAETLTGAGFTVVSVDNFRQGDPPPTRVYYSAATSAATAEAVVAELGAGQAELDASRGEGIVVILGSDYTP